MGNQVVRMFNAVNRGQTDRAIKTFAPRSKFKWYSVTEANPKRGGRHFAAHSPKGLKRYFAGRKTHNERLALLAVVVGRDGGGPGGAGVAFVLHRTADDLRAVNVWTKVAHGKGAVDCTTGRIKLWSMAQWPSGHPGYLDDLCVTASDAQRPTRPLACAAD